MATRYKFRFKPKMGRITYPGAGGRGPIAGGGSGDSLLLQSDPGTGADTLLLESGGTDQLLLEG
jgi:hypothetical protein